MAVLTLPAEIPRARRRLFGRSLPLKAKIGVVIIAIFIFLAIFGPYLAPFDPSAINPAQDIPLAPNTVHLLGTTTFGQDVLSQLLVGIRATVLIGLTTGVIATFLSVVIGVSAGFLGGFADELLSLLSNSFLVLPALPLLVVILGYLPQSGNLVTAFVLSSLGWPWGARVIRAQTMSLRARDYIGSSRETGERTWRIIFFEILPNEVSLIAASFVGTVLYAVLTSVALTFLGLGDLTSWSLGSMLYWVQNQNALILGAWWWFLPPGLCVAVLGMGLVLLNFGLDELGNPRLRNVGQQRKIGGQSWRPADPTPVLRDGQGDSRQLVTAPAPSLAATEGDGRRREPDAAFLTNPESTRGGGRP
ncbi:MAG: ABC transporter permease [Acidimicrobiales bacterium]|jgi:peptide/nickel transport system permease protein